MASDLGKRCDFHNAVDLMGRLSNPPEIAETPTAHGTQRIEGSREGVETAQSEGSEDPSASPREEEGQLSNPPQRRLSPTDADALIAAYRTGASISQLATEFGVHRTTVAGHLDRHGVARHSEQTAWNDENLNEAVHLYATGLSLADVAHQFGIDPQTVANRFRRAGVPVRARRGWKARARSEQDQR